jgi:Rrf2 family protein
VLKLTKKVDYALLSLNFMSHQDEGAITNIREIADAHQIPPEILAKVLTALAKKGLIQSYQAPRGGYSLKKATSEISILDVISAVEGPVVILSCSEGGDRVCQQISSCDVRSPLEKIQGKILWLLETMTLDEFIHDVPDALGVANGRFDLLR